MKTLQTIIACLLASSLNAYPLLGTSGLVGNSRCRPVQNYNYTVYYDNAFGGHWNLTGHNSSNRDGTYTESFHGTVSNTAVNGTYTQANFDWISDGWFVCDTGGHAQVLCYEFSMTFSNGSVTGWATYRP